MDIAEIDDLASARPSKRARIDTEKDREDRSATIVDNMENSSAAEGTAALHETAPIPHIQEAATDFGATGNSESTNGSIPGLGMLGAKEPAKEISTENPTVENLSNAPATTAPELEMNTIGDQTQATEGAEDAESPSVTKALEAMLGGITPPESAPTEPEPRTVGEDVVEAHTEIAPTPEVDIVTTNSLTEASNNITVEEAIPSTVSTEDGVDQSMEGTEQPPTVGASTSQITLDIPESAMLDVNTDMIDAQEAEFEIDSSPIEDSSEDSSDSSDDSSSSEDSEAGEGYELLSAEEQARILMEGEGGSDDEGGPSKGKGAGSQLRTKNEVPEEVIPKPDVVITPEMKIEELGEVEAIVESIALVKAKTTGEYRVLESGSVLCLADRSVIGAVAETLGRVQQPLYSVRFTNATEITEAGLSIGTKIFYSEQHSTYVFTQALKAFKGSDASNLHDEEVGDEEMEFSDDEAEAEHKKRVKQKKMERRGGRMQQNGNSRDDHPLRQESKPFESSMYDDAEDDGPYKPLARPAGFASGVGRTEAPQEGVGYAGRGNRGGRDDNGGRGRGRGDRGRGRGDRGRGNDRGRGRGGYQERRGDGYSQPPRNNDYTQPPQHSPIPPQYPTNSHTYAPQPQGVYSQHQAPQYTPPFPQAPYNQQPSQQQQQPYAPPQQQYPYPFPQPPPNWSNAVPPPPVQNGAYINPAFFPQQPQAGAAPQWGAPPVPGSEQNLADLLRHLQSGRGGQGGAR